MLQEKYAVGGKPAQLGDALLQRAVADIWFRHR